jgi:hypothetical protein
MKIPRQKSADRTSHSNVKYSSTGANNYRGRNKSFVSSIDCKFTAGQKLCPSFLCTHLSFKPKTTFALISDSPEKFESIHEFAQVRSRHCTAEEI